MVIEIRTLQHFIAVADQLHFGRASRQLGIGQPALSKSVQRLEESLDAKLFDRSRRQVALTPIGQAVASRARRIVAEATELTREVDLLVGAEIGTLQIGIGPAMAESCVADAIARLAQQHPQSHLRAQIDHWVTLTASLRDRQLDLFLADASMMMEGEEYRIVPLPSERLIWFARAGHPLASAPCLTSADLLHYPLVTPRMPDWAVTWFGAADPMGTSQMDGSYATVECESYSMLKRMVSSSDCVSAAVRTTIADEIESGELAALPVDLVSGCGCVPMIPVSWATAYTDGRLLPEMQACTVSFLLRVSATP